MKSTLLKTIFIVSLVAATLPMAEARLERGTKELGVQGNLDLDAPNDYLLNLNLTYGYFVRDNLEVGVVTKISASDDYKNLGLGFFAEYNFNNNKSKWVPYVGAAASAARVEFSDDNNDYVDFEDVTALDVKLSLGMKYFVRDNFAITGEVNHNISTDDINFDGDSLKDSATNILIGTRFYF